jgi:hypothetical protein
MTAKQFLLSESTYCRERAAHCPDPFVADGLRHLAECFERTAESADPGPIAAGRAQEKQGSH